MRTKNPEFWVMFEPESQQEDVGMQAAKSIVLLKKPSLLLWGCLTILTASVFQ
jgi:hypothetical protein